MENFKIEEILGKLLLSRSVEEKEATIKDYYIALMLESKDYQNFKAIVEEKMKTEFDKPIFMPSIETARETETALKAVGTKCYILESDGKVYIMLKAKASISLPTLEPVQPQSQSKPETSSTSTQKSGSFKLPQQQQQSPEKLSIYSDEDPKQSKKKHWYSR